MQLGIDFGTTNSAIALFQHGQLVPIEVDPANENPAILPSLIYITKQHEQSVGFQAAQQYLANETGRPVRWEQRYAGEVEMIVGGSGSSPIIVMQDINVLIDVAANGRLLQSIKTALRDPDYDGTLIFDRYYSIDELIVIVLQNLKAKAENQLQEQCDGLVLGRPVKFSDNPIIDNRAEEILFKAAKQAGFDNIRFATEPLAVAYLHHVSSPKRHTALIFDFGGGTLDFTVAELGGKQAPNILASHGVLVGGDDLDRAIMRSLLKYFGKGTRLGAHPFPEEMLEMLLSWQTMPELSRPQYMSDILDFKSMTNKPQTLEALQSLVTRNVGYKLFREIERAKRELSDSIVTKLDFEYEAVKIHEVITRNHFEQMIVNEVKAVKDGIMTALDLAGMQPAQIDVVLRTGGSSIIPTFSRLLAGIFGEKKVRSIDPLTSVVGGMAVIAQEADRPTPQYAIRYEHPTIGEVQAESGKAYEKSIFLVGSRCYTDNTSIISRAPAILNGLPMIKTANGDQNTESEALLTFELLLPSTIYVAYQLGAKTLPKWLRKFESIPAQILINDDWTGERTFGLYVKDFEPGEVTLGGTKAPGYSGSGCLSYFAVARAKDEK